MAFEGFIPDRVRRHIERHKRHFDSVYLVCDVTNAWGLEAAARINHDPLVIGAIEEHTRAEWTSRND